MTDYSRAHCCAITKRGTRCKGRWATASPCTFAWDPIKGEGIDGPRIVLCHRHCTHLYRTNAGERMRVFRGWLGASNKYGYGTSVFRSVTGWKPAKWWWDRRQAVVFGQRGRTDSP